MIVAVQGTRYGNNESAKVLAALAVAGVHKDQKSTLILQFMNRTRKNVENYLVGQKLRNESLVQDTSVSDPTVGMDALCANTSFTTYTPELFSEVTKSLVSSNVPNIFDVAYASRKESFERELLNKNKVSGEDEQSYLETILKAANKVYDMVYILVPSKNEQLAAQLTQLAEVNVVCVHQGMKEDVVHGAQREYYIITDYCAGSAYNSKTLAQAYGQKVIYGSMHNVLFNDACINGLALQFLDKNMDAKKDDYNYPFIHNIILLYNIIVRHKERKQAEADLSVLKSYEGPKLIESVWEPITASVITKVVTTGIFNKTVTHNTCLVADPSAEVLPAAEPEIEQEMPNEAVTLPELDELPDFGDENIYDDQNTDMDGMELEPVTDENTTPEQSEDAELETGISITGAEPVQAVIEPEQEVITDVPATPAPKKSIFDIFKKRNKTQTVEEKPAEITEPVQTTEEVTEEVVEDIQQEETVLELAETSNEEIISEMPVQSKEEVTTSETAEEIPAAISLPDIFDDNADSVSEEPAKVEEPVAEPEADANAGISEVITPVKKKRGRKPKAQVTEEPVNETVEEPKVEEPQAENTETTAEVVTPEKKKRAPRKTTTKTKKAADTVKPEDNGEDDGWTFG